MDWLELPLRRRAARMGAPGGVSGTAGQSTARVPTTYRKLEGSQIRLLRVGPGLWGEPVSCTIHHVPLDERPNYIALSYTWGNPDDTVKILLNGKEHRITRSLFTALRQLRSLCSAGRSLDDFTFCEGIYVWADALCINQKDEHEKEREIPRMRDIYTLSSRVCVWLGEKEGCVDSTLFLQELLDMEEYRLCCQDIHVQVVSMGFEHRVSLKRMIEDVFGDVFVEDTFSILCDLASRDWFRRVWVIQEAALPAADPILMAGPCLFRFEHFTRLCEMVYFIWERGTQAPLAQRSAAGRLVDHAALLRGRIQVHNNPVQARGNLEDRTLQFGRAFENAILSWGYGAFEATQRHDYIYGMIGLCGGNEMMPPALAPNYRKPFLKVCEDYARCIIKSTGRVAILARNNSHLFDYDDNDVPSWVPDFSAWQEPMLIREDPDPNAASFVGPGGRLLKIRGFNIGKVTAVYLPLEWEDEDEVEEDEEEDWDYSDDYDFSDQLRHHHKFLRKVAQEKNTRSKDAVADWLANNIQREPAWSTQPTTQALLKMYWYYYHLDQGDSDPLVPSRPQFDPDVSKTFVRLARYGLTRRNRFLCQGGVLAKPHRRACPPVRRGDHLVALSGSRRPFLLRPVPTTEGPGYVLLNHCHGHDGTSKLHYTHDDFRASLGYHSGRRLEDFIIA
ncbi:heterokaryon incompatibility protein-domain-containing protein [Diaporthe sp. PMI_573]|nr:heterokaryon incompatibility protein-domain-containing protein [Diaporthaceae sp. PMI_573]